MNVICFREIIKRNKNLPLALRLTHSEHRQNPILLFSGLFFSGRRILIFTLLRFVSCSRALCISCCSENISSSIVSSWSPAGIAQQSQDKQVPVLRLFSVSEPFGTELHTPLPFCRVHGKYKICVFAQHIKLNTLQWHEVDRNKET